jgi:hypothetical protein
MELGHFEVGGVCNPDMTIMPSSPSRGRFLKRRVYSDGGRSVLYTEHLDSLGAKVRIDYSRGLRVKVSKSLLHSKNVPYVNVVEPLIRLLLESKGYLLLHSAVLYWDGQALLISAPADTGKTTTVLKHLKYHPTGFLSDDMTIVDRHGKAYCFPKPLTMNAHSFDVLGSNRTVSLKVRGYVHSRVGRRILRILGRLGAIPILSFNAFIQRIIAPPKVEITTLMPGVKIVETANVAAVFLLERGSEAVIEIEPEEAANHITKNNEDAFSFPPTDGLFRNLESRLGLSGKSERIIISSALASIPCYIIRCPSRNWSEHILAVERAPTA